MQPPMVANLIIMKPHAITHNHTNLFKYNVFCCSQYFCSLMTKKYEMVHFYPNLVRFPSQSAVSLFMYLLNIFTYIFLTYTIFILFPLVNNRLSLPNMQFYSFCSFRVIWGISPLCQWQINFPTFTKSCNKINDFPLS